MLAQRELGLREQLQDGHAQVFQAQRLALREPLVREVRERRAAPQGERVLERLRRARRTARRELGAAVREVALEAVGVEGTGVELQLVAVLVRGDRRGGAERPAQAGDVDLHGLRGRGRRLLAPQLVDQPVGAERLVGVQQQHRQQRPLAGTTDRHDTVAAVHLERPEDAEFDAVQRVQCSRPYRTGFQLASAPLLPR